MEKKKKLKGFTLIEMVVVIAIFGMIMAAALTMIDPINKVYTNAYMENDSQSIGENLRRYVGDQLQYADRMYLYTEMQMDDATVAAQVDDFRKHYFFYPYTDYTDRGGPIVESTRERVYPYAKFAGNDEVFVLHIANPDIDPTAPGTTVATSSRLGTVSLSTYVGGVFKGTKEWSSNTDYYDDYIFDISVQTAATVGSVDPATGAPSTENKFIDLEDAYDSAANIYPNNLAMGLKMYRKHRVSGNFATSTIDDTYTNRTITFKLKNLITRTNNISRETIDFKDSTHFSPKAVERFRWFDNSKSKAENLAAGVASNDVYFIFTKAPVIEKVIK